MARETVDKGTHYVEPDASRQQGSYYLPLGLRGAFREDCNEDPSRGASGAFLGFMGLRQLGMHTVRDDLIRTAERVPPKEFSAKAGEILLRGFAGKFIDILRTREGLSPELKALRARIMDEAERALLLDYAQSLPEAEKAKMLAEARKRK